ncbi:MAG TPA: SusC/RagA family TonB-linked outer membrane protein [Ferruginibacter sp.]|nr:SusC/RagA family TonB-linked outer membrane protein [Ferruginibacter sp.]
MRKILLFLSAMFLLLGSVIAQSRVVTGKVTDEKGNPLSNVSIIIKGSNTGTASAADGTYSINVAADAKVLVFSSVNMQTQEIRIADKGIINVGLKIDDKALGELVITGYSTRKKTEFTGANTKVLSRQIEQIPLASFEQILQGRAPGLYIASGSGQPGTAARVNIRGVGSISGGSDPLYVLDGIPIEANVFRSMNPNDFATVDVLKDAVGAGLYGSRGANGVIVITSKKGKSGKTLIQYRSQVGFSDAPSQNNLQLMNTDQRLEYEEKVLGGPAGVLPSNAITGFPGWDYSPNNPRYQTLSAAQRTTEAGLLDSIRKINTDWSNIFFQKGKFSQQELNASGGNQNLSFYTSLSYYKQQGILIRSGLDRYTFRANIDFKSDRLSVNVRSSAGYSSQNSIESEAGVALANPVAAAFLELPYRKLTLANGKNDVGAGKTAANAYDRIFTTTAVSNQFKGNLGITLQYELFGGLALRTSNGVDWRNNNQSRFADPTSFAGASVAQGGQGSYGEGNFENLQLITTSGLVFNRSFRKHVVSASAMVEAIRNKSRGFSVTGYGILARLPNTPVGITPGSATNNFIPTLGGAFLPGNGKTINGLFSLFSTADYTYNKKYTISASLRKDEPSQVAAENRSNIFWAIGGNWNLSMEKFMANQRFVQDVRIRASYGEAGNVNGFASDFGYLQTYGAGGYAGAPGTIPTSPGNPTYKLESQLITNIGADISFWNKRVRVTVDAYKKDSRNLFINQNLSRTSGFTALATNAAKMRNKGFEFTASVDAFKTDELLVTVGVNGAFNKNEVLDLGGLTEIPQGTGIIRVGESLGTHYVVGYLGVDPQSGQPVYEDLNGNPTNVYSAANSRATYGTFLPKFTGGANLDISWKRFDISALFSTAQGVKRFNNESFFYETTNSNAAFNKRVEMLTTWQKPGDITDYQRVSAVRQFSSKDIRDASFVRFRNLTAGYTFEPKNSRFFRSFRIWGQGQNLFTWTKWTGFDPEESNNIATYEFPNPRTYSVGIDINF